MTNSELLQFFEPLEFNMNYYVCYNCFNYNVYCECIELKKENKMKNTKKIEELQNEIKRLEQEQKAPKKETMTSLTDKFQKSQDQLAVAVEALQFMKQFRQLSREVYITATRALEKIEGMK